MSILDFFKKKKPIPAPWKKYYTEDDLNIKIPNISMYEQVRKTALLYPNLVAIKYFNVSITYKKLMSLIDQAAMSLETLNVKKGDIVTICLPNLPEVLIVLYALNKLGAIGNMLHPLSAEEEIRQSVEKTKSKLLFFMDSFYSKIENVIHSTCVKKVIFVSPADSFNFIMKIGYKIKQRNKYKNYPKDPLFTSFKKFMNLSKNKKPGKYPKYGRNTPAVILHSGGTSGTPKNIVMQNRAFILLSLQGEKILHKLKVGDSCLTIMPNFHGFGLGVVMHTPLVLGVTVILVPQFDAKKFDVLLNKTKPNCVLGVPTLYEALINSNNVKNLDLSYLKYVISGGDILSKGLEEKVNDYFKSHNSDVIVAQGYGLSESLAAVILAVDDLNKSGSVGIPLPGNYVKIIDRVTRNTMPYNEVGEIVIHTKGMMMGYLNDETETNAALQVHDDGYVWLHTGDLGYMDENGYVFYKGRKKRMIITSGYNVYPTHVEEVIESHPAVLQCTVIGVPHPYKQEVGKAFIVLKSGYHGLFVKADIKNYCKKNLAKYMIPQTFVYRKKLPKTKLGKVDFQKLQSDIGVDDDET